MDDLSLIYNFLQLDERVATAGQPLDDEFPLIAQSGYQVVINLALHDADYSIDDEVGLVAALGMHYEHRPVTWTAPQAEDLDWFFQVMEKHRDKKCFVHCAANMRVSCFMVLYRVIKLGWQYDDAMQWVQRIWTVDEIWSTFIHSQLQTHKDG